MENSNDSLESSPLLKRKAINGDSPTKPKSRLPKQLTYQFWRSKITKENLPVLGYFLLLVVIGVANNVTGRFNQLKFGDNYAFFNNNFTTLAYCIMSQIVTWYKLYYTKDITPEMRKFPIWKYVMFGLFDGVAAVLFSIGAPNTPATLQNVMNQAIIPMTMVASYFMLKQKYKLIKILGATIIIGGTIIALIPVFQNGDTGAAGTVFKWYSVLIYFSNNVPQALSNVTKEMAFQNIAMDIYYLGTWVAWFQFVFSLLFLPVTSLDAFGGTPMSEIPSNIANGLRCFIGENSQAGDHCENNYIATSLYIIVNFLYNVVILLVTKHAGATVFTLAFAIRLPLTQIIYCLEFVMGSYAEEFNWTSIVSLLVVLFGFAVYVSVSDQPESVPVIVEFGDDQVVETKVMNIPFINARGGTGEMMIQFQKVHMPRTGYNIRNAYLSRLGFGPQTRSPNDTPSYRSVNSAYRETEPDEQDELFA
eukprot:Colp12_sorted_trinity150504_noHs@24381